MYAGSVLKRVDGLTYDRLIYFVRAGYIRPKKIKKQSLYHNDFSEEDVELIEYAWKLISSHDLKPSAAFKKAWQKGKDLQLTLNFEKLPNNS